MAWVAWVAYLRGCVVNYFGVGQIFFGIGQNFLWSGSNIFWCRSRVSLALVKIFFTWVKSFFGVGQFIQKTGRNFYNCLESSLKVDYLKITWKLEGLSKNCRKIQKTFIKQNVFSRKVFLKNTRPLYQCNEK